MLRFLTYHTPAPLLSPICLFARSQLNPRGFHSMQYSDSISVSALRARRSRHKDFGAHETNMGCEPTTVCHQYILAKVLRGRPRWAQISEIGFRGRCATIVVFVCPCYHNSRFYVTDDIFPASHTKQYAAVGVKSQLSLLLLLL